MTGTIAVERPGGITFSNNQIQCPHCKKVGTYGQETVWKMA